MVFSTSTCQYGKDDLGATERKVDAHNNAKPPKRGKNPTHSKHKKLRKLVLGLKQVGSRNDAPYDRVTGAGFVAAYNGGQYADALSKRPKASASPYSSPKPLARSQPRVMTILRLLARQTRLPGATDNTRYGEGRASPRSFLTHHVANISTAIQAADTQTVLNAASARMLRVSFGVCRVNVHARTGPHIHTHVTNQPPTRTDSTVSTPLSARSTRCERACDFSAGLF